MTPIFLDNGCAPGYNRSRMNGLLANLDLNLTRALEPVEAKARSAVTPLVRLRDRHHWIARLLAAGASPLECSAATGLALARISQLVEDPSFKELMTLYRAEVESEQLDLQSRLSALAGTALSEILERLEDSPRDFSVKELREVATAALDRIGLGPTSKVESNNVNWTPQEVKEMKELAASGGRATVIVATPEDSD